MESIWKRLASGILASCMATSMVAFAADTTTIYSSSETEKISSPNLNLDVVSIPVTYYNEIEEVLFMREATSQDLAELNISEETAQEIADTNIEQAYYDRAQLSEEQLAGLGYTDEQISILKQYDGSTITANSPILKASASCTGTASKVSTSTSKIAFKYSWSWSSAPVYMHTDKVAVKWQAYNSNSSAIDVTNKQSTSVNYYWMNGKYNTAKSISTPTLSTFNGCSANIPVQEPKELNGEANFIWAKSGSTTVTLSKSNSNISYIKFSGSYGHLQLSLATSISVDIGAGISISFSPNSVTKTATITRKLTSSGTLTSI